MLRRFLGLLICHSCFHLILRDLFFRRVYLLLREALADIITTVVAAYVLLGNAFRHLRSNVVIVLVLRYAGKI